MSTLPFTTQHTECVSIVFIQPVYQTKYTQPSHNIMVHSEVIAFFPLYENYSTRGIEVLCYRKHTIAYIHETHAFFLLFYSMLDSKVSCVLVFFSFRLFFKFFAAMVNCGNRRILPYAKIFFCYILHCMWP